MNSDLENMNVQDDDQTGSGPPEDSVPGESKPYIRENVTRSLSWRRANTWRLKDIKGEAVSLFTRFEKIIHADGTIAWSTIHEFEEGGIRYTSEDEIHHKDSLGRDWIGSETDQYLSATDGQLSKLIVQATPTVRDGARNSTWARTKLRNPTPLMLRVMLWAMRDTIEKKSFAERNKREDVSFADKAQMYLRWAPACVGIFLLLFVPADLGGEVRNNGLYEHFKYHYWGYALISSNPLEHPPTSTRLVPSLDEVNPIRERPLRPTYLWVLRPERGGDLCKVSDLPNGAVIEYVFVSYTTTQFNHKNQEDVNALFEIGATAARKAGVQGVWLGCACMPEESLQEEVFRISDVVRGAHSLVIAVGPPVGSNLAPSSTSKYLEDWGSRMWTFPEVLLSPSTHPISVYCRGLVGSPLLIRKRNFPGEVWCDDLSRQLVDHYEGSIILSALELVSIALECLRARKTVEHLPGDMSYVLMGLLRRRPKVDGENTAFQAFCRLSLSNDSNQLLERLICLLPSPEQNGHRAKSAYEWNKIEDYFWNRNLWDIEPLCQVVGVGADDTVILSGAFGTSIRWKSFTRVNLLMRNTIKRMVVRVAVRGVPGWFFIGVILLATSKSKGGSTMGIVTGLGWLFMGLTIIFVVFSPYLLSLIYVGKAWSAQPWLFGIEGYMPIDDIERSLFGVNLNRLRWSPYGSDLSRHKDCRGECVGKDPTIDKTVQAIVDNALRAPYGSMKVFTLVDTNTMTVTLFQAARPPVAMMLCGSEGGMQRALLCSYDSKSQTLYRETVLRVDTLVLERMPRVDRFRLGLAREPSDTEPESGIAQPAESV